MKYHQTLDQYARDGRVSLIMHDKNKKQHLRPISYKVMIALKKRGAKPIITANCSSCAQQIDLLSVS